MDTLEPTPSTTLLSAQEAKDPLREIVEGFFFRRLRTEDGKRVGRLLVKSPPGLGKTREAIEWAIAYQAEQAGKNATRLSVDDFNEAGVPAQAFNLRPAPSARRGADGGDRRGFPGKR